MRDIVLTLIVVALVPMSFVRPYIGILAFSWLSYMSPHRLTWGFAYDLPFAQMIAAATLAGIPFTKDSKKFPWNATVAVWLIFLAWMCFTTLFALDPDEAVQALIKVAKIQLMALVTMYVMGTRERMHLLVWVIAMSLGFYGVKGGVFALLTGGQHRVWGPAGSFIEDNNSLGLALIMTLPLLRFLQMQSRTAWVRLGLIGMMGLTVAATLSTQSRGAFIGLCAMGALLWLKGRNKIAVGLALVVFAPAAYFAMPASWHERMSTIETYDQDSSAVGRINAWRFTLELASQRVTGGGFRGIELESAYRTYAPQLYEEIMSKPNGAIRAAHSIWFGMLGQHGWIGLGLFVLLGFMAWRNGSWVISRTRGRPELAWYNDLARMLQVSLLGYAAAGTFLSMEYFDFYYHLLALLVLAQFVLQREIAALDAGAETRAEVTPAEVTPAAPPPVVSPAGLRLRTNGFSGAEPPRRG